jgi:hypothetical protein
VAEGWTEDWGGGGVGVGEDLTLIKLFNVHWALFSHCPAQTLTTLAHLNPVSSAGCWRRNCKYARIDRCRREVHATMEVTKMGLAQDDS